MICRGLCACTEMLWLCVLYVSATVIVRAGGAIWLNPFAMVLFSVCSAVTVQLHTVNNPLVTS